MDRACRCAARFAKETVACVCLGGQLLAGGGSDVPAATASVAPRPAQIVYRHADFGDDGERAPGKGPPQPVGYVYTAWTTGSIFSSQSARGTGV